MTRKNGKRNRRRPTSVGRWSRSPSPAETLILDPGNRGRTQGRSSAPSWSVKRPRSTRSRRSRWAKSVIDSSPCSLSLCRDGVSLADAKVQVDGEPPVRVVLKVVAPARSTREVMNASDAKFLMEENERLRAEKHAEDSAYKKELKTLKRKLYGVVELCDSHGVTVPGKYLLPS